MLDIDTLNIIKINGNMMIHIEMTVPITTVRNTAICQSTKHVQHYTNIMQDVDRAKKFYANIDTILKFPSKGI